MRFALLLIFTLGITSLAWARNLKALVFVAHEDAYYSEYIVLRKTLEAAGYQVDLRSATVQPAAMYMLPAGTDIAATANTLPGSSYAVFTQQFFQKTGFAWESSWNAVPATVPVDGSILDVNNLATYQLMAIVGGTGTLAYRVDGSYANQGSGTRQIAAAVVQAVALKLNQLALEAMANQIPILAQCHGASLPVFWRIPGTSGPGAEQQGFSLLKNQKATGFPEPQTATDLASLQVIFAPNERLTISRPHPSSNLQELGKSRLITSRDWYPQTVLFAASAVIEVAQSYPKQAALTAVRKLLILHGGAVDSTNCSPANLNNDIPCNYGTGMNLPADYRHLRRVFEFNSIRDDFQFNVSDLNLQAANLPFSLNDSGAIHAYFLGFDAVIFFKHWASNVTQALQKALTAYTEAGYGVMALHHALYNHQQGGNNKNGLVQLFGAESAMNTWSANLTQMHLVNVQEGHFVSNYGLDADTLIARPASWLATAPPAGNNQSFSTYPAFRLFDELYNNLNFIAGTSFGSDENQIHPLFSNDQVPATQAHCTGFLRLYNMNNDSLVGRLVYLSPGERRESFDTTAAYAQILRNAAIWVANPPQVATLGLGNLHTEPDLLVYPNPLSGRQLQLQYAGTQSTEAVLYNLQGQQVHRQKLFPGSQSWELPALPAGMYLLRYRQGSRKLLLQ